MAPRAAAAPRTTAGPPPPSEPETTGYVALAQTHRPSLAVSYHSYGEDVIHPYGCDTATTPKFHLLRDLSSDLAARIVGDGGSNWYAYGTSSETLGYLVDGGMKDWFYGALGAPAWTIEINGSIPRDSSPTTPPGAPRPCCESVRAGSTSSTA